ERPQHPTLVMGRTPGVTLQRPNFDFRFDRCGGTPCEPKAGIPARDVPVEVFLSAPRFASRLLTFWTREELVLDMTGVSALAYFVQWHWRRRPAFRNRAAPHVFVESRR